MNVESIVSQAICVSDFSDAHQLRVGLSKFFQGYFLRYSVQCEEPQLCQEGGPIQVNGGYTLSRINLQDKLKASNPKQVFQYQGWVVLIDEMNIFNGIRMNSTYSESQTDTLVDMSSLQIEEIRYALSFKENFGSESYTYFWVIQGSHKFTEQQIFLLYEIEDESELTVEYVLSLDPVCN